MKPLITILLCFFVCTGSSYANSVIDSTKKDGHWSDPTIWKNGRVPHDSDYVVINNYVYLDQNVTLSYPGGGAMYITPNGDLCGPYTVDCELISYGPASCNYFIWEGNSVNYSNIVWAYEAHNGAYETSWASYPPGTICVGCPISCPVAVPIAQFSVPDPICVGNNVTCTDESTGNALSWLWLFPGGTPSESDLENPTVVYNTPGTYTITLIVSNLFGSDTTYKTIHVNPVPVACCDTNISFGKSATLRASGAVSYSWVPPAGLSCTDCPNPVASPLFTTTYTVIMVSDSGCNATDAITVTVICADVFVPDAFSPNGDDQNDVLYVRGACIQTIDFLIFDRWGNKVFESQNLDSGWDGKDKGQSANTGTYVYYLKATMFDGSTIEKKGTVALLR